MTVIFSEQAWADFNHWIQSNPRMAKRIVKMIHGTLKTPSSGIGKPEPLKHDFAGYWSRRINEEHRMIYKIDQGQLLIAQLRYHYS